MREIVRAPDQLVGHVVMRRVILVRPGDAEGAPDGLDRGGAGALIEGDANLRLAHFAQVQPFIHGRFHHRRLQRPDIHGDRVKEAGGAHVETGLLEPFCQPRGFAVNALRNGL